MKRIKIIFMIVLLIGLMTLSTLLCACNKDEQPIDNKDAQLSGDKEEQTSSNKEEQLPGKEDGALAGDNNPDWVKVYKYNELSLKANNCSAIIKSKEGLDEFCDADTSSCFKTSTVHDLFPDITEEELKENEKVINSYVEFFNEANQDVIDVLQKYDEQFFEEKSLVVLFAVRSSSSFAYNYEKHAIVDNGLHVTLSLTINKGDRYPTDIKTFVYILEFDKDEVAGVQQINVEEILYEK